jgi:hypothetical protein
MALENNDLQARGSTRSPLGLVSVTAVVVSIYLMLHFLSSLIAHHFFVRKIQFLAALEVA